VKRRFYNERRLLGFETAAGGKFYGTERDNEKLHNLFKKAGQLSTESIDP
jgi:hypothetical protein